LLASPIRRLKAALRDAAVGDLDFRISHNRRDEFGELFESFNLMATSMQERMEAADRAGGRPVDVAATRIEPSQAATTASAPSASPVRTPFDPAWPQAV
jgi:methyl-accepting chemotaxis protein